MDVKPSHISVGARINITESRDSILIRLIQLLVATYETVVAQQSVPRHERQQVTENHVCPNTPRPLPDDYKPI
jgi:hypothetical protein